MGLFGHGKNKEPNPEEIRKKRNSQLKKRLEEIIKVIGESSKDLQQITSGMYFGNVENCQQAKADEYSPENVLLLRKLYEMLGVAKSIGDLQTNVSNVKGTNKEIRRLLEIESLQNESFWKEIYDRKAANHVGVCRFSNGVITRENNAFISYGNNAKEMIKYYLSKTPLSNGEKRLLKWGDDEYYVKCIKEYANGQDIEFFQKGWFANLREKRVSIENLINFISSTTQEWDSINNVVKKTPEMRISLYDLGRNIRTRYLELTEGNPNIEEDKRYQPILAKAKTVIEKANDLYKED